MSTSEITLRPMEPSDIPFGMRLTDAAGWNQVDADWEMFLRLRPTGCFVASIDGVDAGTVTTVDYDGVAWIGMVLVDEAMRRRGVGTRSLLTALESLADVDVVKLDATPAGQLVYEPHGFVVERELLRWRRTGSAEIVSPSGSVRSMRHDDLDEVLALDAGIFGGDRGVLLRSWRSRAPELAHVDESDGEIRGYVFGRDGAIGAQAGPLAAPDVTSARALLGAALVSSVIIVDSFCGEEAWEDALRALGFAVERPLLRMRRGPRCETGDSQALRVARLFLVAGPEFG